MLSGMENVLNGSLSCKSETIQREAQRQGLAQNELVSPTPSTCSRVNASNDRKSGRKHSSPITRFRRAELTQVLTKSHHINHE